MLPETFEFVLGLIAEQLQRTANGNKMILPEKQFLIALWRMATPDSYRYESYFVMLFKSLFEGIKVIIVSHFFPHFDLHRRNV